MLRPARLSAVIIISAATLSYEILLVRVFAIEHFHHFAYMAIGVAMLGFGTSGTLLAIVGKIEKTVAARLFVWSAFLSPLTLIASPTLVHLILLDPTQLAWDPSQWLKLAIVYTLLALPFAVGALCVLLALVLDSDAPGSTYGASFMGSGLGAILALLPLWFVLPGRALAVPAFVAALGAVAAARDVPGAARARLGGWISLVTAGLVFVFPLWHIHVSPYKALPQVEAYPDARRVSETPDPLGWVVAVQASAFRHAPGLSLGFSGSFPSQTALFVDGDIAGATTSSIEPAEVAAVSDWVPTALPYAFTKRDRVLVIGAGGGTEVRNAVSHDADRIVAVELHPELVRHARRSYGPIAVGETEVEWIVGEARGFIARTNETFDLISLAPVGGMGTSAAGVYALNEDFLHTVEAYVSYLNRLTNDGILSITRWMTVPPRENVRVILTAGEAMRRVAADHLSDGIVVMRSWGTATVLVKPSGFSPAEVDSLLEWSRRRLFDIDWGPGRPDTASVFNHLDEPTLYRAAAVAVGASDSSRRFADRYPFSVAPVSDSRPYPHHFLRLGSVGSILSSDRGAWLPFAEWGPIALVATLVQSAMLALLLMVVPAAILKRREHKNETQTFTAYFLVIGFAYLAAEIAAIQQLSLLLGHPVYAVSLVLSTCLICSGAGSIISDRISPSGMWLVNGLLLGILLLAAAALLGVVHLLMPSPFAVRLLVAVTGIGTMAFFMGMPFPLGIRSLVGTSQTQIAWAWAVNGFASVVAAPLAALISIERGSPELFLFAALAYGVAGVLGYGRRK